ncbi:uncharacterized protein BCR38DRAFT_483193 [Pseudomassariella vexata]|uniref:Nephrocystin 3-like N-terminal domain-containing protein n=1 Tax=Pseudomassariella vexata TaxID=1141098 RepID=A0A1Y2E7N2_9PEZI|nr:uncharacterized protein BCR38DRAFT_483193 [Pseudomassariella vexata]ORY67578.1 hypothetical protein BCR38DRAFT_483193 [Pseudomassariella vexata]
MATRTLSHNSYGDNARIHQGDVILDNSRQNLDLQVAQDASFDSRADEHNEQCHPDTRTDLLQYIQTWADDPYSECIFLLNGKAGTGKSTISRTLATRFNEQRILGASFFFKRGERGRGDAALFFTTIAKQLIDEVPAMAPYIRDAVKSDSSIHDKALKVQFDKLILQPLGKMGESEIPPVLVIVVDALDECDGLDDIKIIIHLLSRLTSLTPVRLRVFVTSRPELAIRLGFKDIQGTYLSVELDQIPDDVVERDITTFLNYKLARIREEYSSQVYDDLRLPSDWPGKQVVQTLVRMAVPLFSFAATLCRFIEDEQCWDPAGQLEKILNYRTTGDDKFDKFGATYNPVLDQLLVNRTGARADRILNEFRNVVGSIVLLAEPLSALCLSKLLQVTMQSITPLLNRLHSVLHIPSQADVPIRLFHLSFRDFLIDPADRGKPQFWVDGKETHAHLASNCLRIMNEVLRRNICGIQEPGTPRSSIDPQMIGENLQLEVQYACRHWSYHLQQASALISDDNEAYCFLNRHFLHWLEALSLLGRASESVQAIKTLKAVVQPDSFKAISFLNDANRFVLVMLPIIQQAPLQVYSSALAFAPTSSVIRMVIEQEITSRVSLLPKVESDWGQCQQLLEGRSSNVRSVVVSHDSKLVASASDDKTVRIWSADTSDYIRKLECHSDTVN